MNKDEDVTDVLVRIMDDMNKAKLPIHKCDTTNGYDFYFKRGLTKEEQNKAKSIAKKYIKTTYTWHTK
jgi:hypothetical protein